MNAEFLPKNIIAHVAGIVSGMFIAWTKVALPTTDAAELAIDSAEKR